MLTFVRMPQNAGKTCDWFDCKSVAVKRVRFGLRVLEVLKQKNVEDIPYTPQISDLCQFHVNAAKLNHIHFAEIDIDDTEQPNVDS